MPWPIIVVPLDVIVPVPFFWIGCAFVTLLLVSDASCIGVFTCMEVAVATDAVLSVFLDFLLLDFLDFFGASPLNTSFPVLPIFAFCCLDELDCFAGLLE